MIYGKIKNVPNHQPGIILSKMYLGKSQQFTNLKRSARNNGELPES